MSKYIDDVKGYYNDKAKQKYLDIIVKGTG
jgi:hypothetical protein